MRLTERQLDYARRCAKILRKTQRKLSQRAVAEKLGVSTSLLSKALAAPIHRAPAPAKDKRHTPIGFRGIASSPCTLGGFDVEGSTYRHNHFTGD